MKSEQVYAGRAAPTQERERRPSGWMNLESSKGVEGGSSELFSRVPPAPRKGIFGRGEGEGGTDLSGRGGRERRWKGVERGRTRRRRRSRIWRSRLIEVKKFVVSRGNNKLRVDFLQMVKNHSFSQR